MQIEPVTETITLPSIHVSPLESKKPHLSQLFDAAMMHHLGKLTTISRYHIFDIIYSITQLQMYFLVLCIICSQCKHCGQQLLVKGEMLMLPDNLIIVIERNIATERMRNTTPIVIEE